MAVLLNRKLYILFFLLLIFSFNFCTYNNSAVSIKQVLSHSGNNRAELEKVLEHYKNDSLKLDAAKFLITNMPGSYSLNDKTIDICKPYYNYYDTLAKAYNYEMNAERGRKIDSTWNLFHNYNYIKLNLPVISDLEHISAKTIISEIDLAFKAWRNNVYSQNSTFEEFCEYILPYRRMNGIVIDDSRNTFFNRHYPDYYTKPGKDMIDETDSLLYEYKNITHSQFWGTRIPILNAETFELLKYGLCEHRCWYNSLLLSSLGMGKDVIYLPCYYEKGALTYAGDPFLLNADGYINYFNSDINDTETLYIKHYAGAPLHYGNKWNNISIEKTRVYGSLTENFDEKNLIAVFPDSIELGNKKISVEDNHVVFNNIPQGALLLLKHQDRNNTPGSRPFIYRNNEVLWY